MLDWIIQNFPDLYGDGNVIVANNDFGDIGANKDWLSTQLGTDVPPTYVYLKTTDLYTKMGWNWIIDQWHDKGIIV